MNELKKQIWAEAYENCKEQIISLLESLGRKDKDYLKAAEYLKTMPHDHE